MAIDAYTGLPRSGKSYSVVKNVIIPSLKEKRTIRTNIPLDASITEQFGGEVHQLEAEWFKDADLCDSFQPGEVIILDELWRRWPAGLKANNANIKDKEFLAEHGHKVDDKGQTMRVVLVTQDLSQISSWARDLVDKTYRMTKMDAVGSTKRFRVDIYQGAVTGQRPSKATLLRQTFDKYEPEFYKWYKSATHSQTGEVGDESRSDKRANAFKRPSLIALAILVVLAPIFGIWGLSNFFSQGQKPEIVEPVEVALVNPMPDEVRPQPQQHPQAEAVKLPPGQLASSPFWRVAGYIDLPAKKQGDSKAKRQVLLATEPNGRRIVSIDSCTYYENGIDVYCDLDGYRVTPWSGRAAATTVFGATSGQPVDLTGRSERSEQRAVKPTDHQAKSSTDIVVVADNSREPRTLYK